VVFDKTVKVGCSLGVVAYPEDGLHSQQLLYTADERMYEAKRKRKARGAGILNFPRPVQQAEKERKSAADMTGEAVTGERG
jgi:GGDEF domain-containing protein